MHYLLTYELVDDYIERRAEFRDDHLALAWKSHKQGNLVLGGALSDPADSAVLLFKGDSPTVAEEFAKNDPYVKNNLVKKWSVRLWTTVVGRDASNPVNPNVSGE
ncbi:MAG: YciI-like protein [Balneolaceae bacterium]